MTSEYTENATQLNTPHFLFPCLTFCPIVVITVNPYPTILQPAYGYLYLPSLI